MRILSRAVFREVVTSALLGTVLFTFILFLQRLKGLFEQLVRGSTEPSTVLYLSGLVYVPTLPFAVPVGVLVGILIALSRQSADNEITAMRASGVPARSLLWPVLSFGFLGFVVAAAASTWLTPWSIREAQRILNQVAAAQLTAEIQEQVFDEQFPNKILYVRNVVSGKTVQWREVFLADLTPPDQRKGNGARETEGPSVTFAKEALATPDVPNNRIQLSLRAGSTHEFGKQQASDYSTAFPAMEQTLEAQKREARQVKAYTEVDTVPLYRLAYGEPPNVEARLELNQRLALPFACILFAMVGLPLGISQRRAGKSFAFVVTVLLAFLYFMGYIGLRGMAMQRALPAEFAVWLPNLVFLAVGLYLLIRMERAGEATFVTAAQTFFQDAGGWLSNKIQDLGSFGRGVATGRRTFPFLPQVIDTYVLTTFIFYFVLLLVSFVLLTDVFTFFELLSDIVKNKKQALVAPYLWYLIPKFIYDFTPFAVLVAVLVTFGVMSKNNEVTAFKASGVSLYRLAAPVILFSMLLSMALFAFDYYYLPEANRKQDALRSEIKGKPPQSNRPDLKYIYGQGPRIYYYRYFEPADNVMLGVNVYEIDTKQFRLQHMIAAEKARWEPGLGTWVFQNGARRSYQGLMVDKVDPFFGQTRTYAHLTEPPSYFLREVKLSIQMNFRELRDYIRLLQQRGFDATRLEVQYHGKFSTPLSAFIMAMISVPFAFLTGNRGAMAGVGVSLGIGIAYLSINKLFEVVGSVNQLPPEVAAWSPNGIFFLAGLYLIMRMRT